MWLYTYIPLHMITSLLSACTGVVRKGMPLHLPQLTLVIMQVTWTHLC